MSNDINRREFLILTAAVLTSSKTVQAERAPTAERITDVGPASDYAKDGVYAAFQNQGFFVVRKGGQLFALSAICTHRRCKLATQSDHSFYCRCHGSAFDSNGRVTEGPAKRDLPQFSTMVNERGHLMVKVAPL